MVLCDKLTNI